MDNKFQNKKLKMNFKYIKSYSIFEQMSTGEKLQYQLREFNQKKSSLERLVMSNIETTKDISKNREDIINSNPFLSKYGTIINLKASIEKLNNRLKKSDDDLKEYKRDLSSTSSISDTDTRQSEQSRLKEQIKKIESTKDDISIRIKEIETDIKDKEIELKQFLKEQEDKLKEIKSSVFTENVNRRGYGLGAHVGFWGVNYGKDSGNVRDTFGEKGDPFDKQTPGNKKPKTKFPYGFFNPATNEYISEDEIEDLKRDYINKCKVDGTTPIEIDSINTEKIRKMYNYLLESCIFANYILESMEKIGDNIVEWDFNKIKKNITTKERAYDFFKAVLKQVEKLSSFMRVSILKVAITLVMGFIPTHEIANIPTTIEITNEVKEILNKKEEKVDIFKYGHELSLSNRGRHEIKTHEKLKLEAYDIGDGMITIGYGHAKPKGKSKYKKGDAIDIQTAESLFNIDVKWAEDGVKRMFSQWKEEGVEVKITQPQFDVLVSLAYNMGVSGLRRSKLVQEIKKGDMESAAKLIPHTALSKKHEKGLRKRRLKEQEYFILVDVDELVTMDDAKWDFDASHYKV